MWEMDRRTILALLVAGTLFMENLDATVITPAIPVMANSFGISPIHLNIGVSAYMLTLGIFIPISGWVATRFGTKRVFTLAIILFTIASLICGLSTSLTQFVLARILQGIGGALMVPVGRLVVLNETPKDELVKAIAVLTWPALIAPVLGPLFGGFIADHGNWQWIFWLNLPLGILAVFIALKIVPNLKLHHNRAFDWLGFFLTGGGLFCLMAATEILSKSNNNWNQTIIILTIGIILTLMSVFHLKRTKTPMFNLKLLTLPTFAVTIWGGSLFRMSISAVPFLLPLMFQIGFGFDAFSAGMMLMAVFAGNLVMKPMTTNVLNKYGFKRVLVINGILNAIFIGSCALFTDQIPLWLIYTILFFGGMARSMQFTAYNSLAFADVPKSYMSDANTLFSMAFQLAMGLGIAVGAMAWHIGESIAYNPNGILAFRIAFLIIAFISLLDIIDTTRLKSNAGDHVLKNKI